VADSRLVLRIAGLIFGLLAVVLQGRRLAGKAGGTRVARTVVVSLAISGVLVGWAIRMRLHPRARPTIAPAATATPSPSTNP